jgi:hypothetical protein
MNYKICTYEELLVSVKSAITRARIDLADSPISLKSKIDNMVGFFYGVCIVRDFDFPLYELTQWIETTNNPVQGA